MNNNQDLLFNMSVGTILSVSYIVCNDILCSALLATVGAIVSLIVSLLIRYLIRKAREKFGR